MRRGLGRGLDSLLGANGELPELVLLPTDEIVIPDSQPRVDPGELGGLVASIRRVGLLQPLVVVQRDEGYEVLAGTRRLMAARMAGLDRVPAILVEPESDVRTLEISLAENLLRKDLSPIEEANALRDLNQMGMSHEEIAEALGLDRSTVSNKIRLLGLAPEVQSMLHRGQLSEGHGRALLRIADPDEQVRVARVAVERGLSVRDLEAMLRPRAPRDRGRNPKEVELEGFFERKGLRAKVRFTKRGITLSLRFKSEDELRRFIELWQ